MSHEDHGVIPERDRIHLVTGSDFLDGYVGSEDWPAGTTLSWEFADGTSWAAVISGADATWSVDKAVADAMAHGTAAKLLYVNGSSDLILALATVVRHD